MKKIVMIVAIATIPLVTIVGGLYVHSELKMNKIIVEAVEGIEEPYYKGIASACFNKDKSEYTCCLASVYSMIDLEAKLADNSVCAGMETDVLKCLGSYKWCVPTSSNDDEKTCVTDDDCVAATCCHATDVVNKDSAPDCEGQMCTMSCESVLDCGRGEPVCNDGVCEVKIKQ
ncbi:MAG: hypothetical protein ABFQ53_02415 [Patescibacteria group bacterium]